MDSKNEQLQHTCGGTRCWRIGMGRRGDGASLVRVVNELAQSTFEAATFTQDEVSMELREAWANALGLNGDPSDAGDHAIKAVEDMLIPVVCPNKAKANLGGVIGDLDNQVHVWKLCLPGHDLSEDVASLVSMHISGHRGSSGFGLGAVGGLGLLMSVESVQEVAQVLDRHPTRYPVPTTILSCEVKTRP